MRYSTYDDLTVRQYQEIFSINSSEMADEDKVIQSICVLTGATEREVEELTIPEFNKISKELAEIFTKELPDSKPPRRIKAGRKLYGITYNPRNLAYYQYADIQSWIGRNAITNMHRIVASLVYPVKRYGFLHLKQKNDPNNHPEISEAILDCKYKDVHSICVFFSLLWNNSIKALADSLVPQIETLTQNEKKILKEILQSSTDGFITPK